MLDKREIEKLLDIAQEDGGDFAELYYEKKESDIISMEENKIKSVKSGDSEGVGIRVISKDKEGLFATGYAYSEDLSFDALKNTAITASKIAKDKVGTRYIVSLQSPKRKPILVAPISIPPERIEKSEKANLVKRINERARKDDRIKQVLIGYQDMKRHFLVANSLGLFIEDTEIYTRVGTQVLAIKDNIAHPGMAVKGGYIGYELYKGDVPEKIAREAVDMAITMLEAKEAPAGEMPVVIARGDGSVLIHEAIGHGLEADHIQKNDSAYTDKLGKSVGSELVTIIDDPTIPYQGGSIKIDSEGTDATRTVLVEKGIVKGFMYDYLTAKKANAQRTGNGRRESFKHYPIPRMTNTCLLEGKSTFDEILKSTKKGFYAKKFSGGQVNTASGNFTFSVIEGYMIEDGKITFPVRGATLIGNGIEVLENVDMVGNDFIFSPGGGMCGKVQHALVGHGQPTIRIKKLVVGGTKI